MGLMKKRRAEQRTQPGGRTSIQPPFEMARTVAFYDPMPV